MLGMTHATAASDDVYEYQDDDDVGDGGGDDIIFVRLYPATPPLSILLAKVTSLPRTSYCQRFCPSTPPSTAPVCMPTRMFTPLWVFSRTHLK